MVINGGVPPKLPQTMILGRVRTGVPNKTFFNASPRPSTRRNRGNRLWNFGKILPPRRHGAAVPRLSVAARQPRPRHPPWPRRRQHRHYPNDTKPWQNGRPSNRVVPVSNKSCFSCATNGWPTRSNRRVALRRVGAIWKWPGRWPLPNWCGMPWIMIFPIRWKVKPRPHQTQQ